MKKNKTRFIESDPSGLDGMITMSMIFTAVFIGFFGAYFLLINKTIAYVLFGISAVFIGIGIFVIKRGIYKRPNLKYLTEKGIRVTTEYLGAEVDKNVMITQSVTYTATQPYILKTKGFDPVSSKEKIYDSQYVWVDPRMFLKKGQKIDVYVDPKDGNKYYMDIEFLQDECDKLLEKPDYLL